jgi:hypothetical protein
VREAVSRRPGQAQHIVVKYARLAFVLEVMVPRLNAEGGEYKYQGPASGTPGSANVMIHWVTLAQDSWDNNEHGGGRLRRHEPEMPRRKRITPRLPR